MSENTGNMTNTFDLVERLKTEMPEMWSQAQVVGKWVWLEFSVPPLKEVRAKLKELGFRWNQDRRCWQHSSGVVRRHARGDPRSYYQVTPADELELRDGPSKPAVSFANRGSRCVTKNNGNQKLLLSAVSASIPNFALNISR